MHKYTRLGGVEALSSREVLEIRCSEITSVAIYRAVLATWLTEYHTQFLAVHVAFAKPADIKFPRENTRTAGVVTDGELRRQQNVLIYRLT